MGENWTCNGTGSSHLSASTDLEATKGNAAISVDLGSLDERADMAASTLATTCQSPIDPHILQIQMSCIHAKPHHGMMGQAK